jgi:O-antigen/teichoic acid export membrane protein
MWASRVLLLVPQLILVPYLIGKIGESGYGVYAMIWPLVMAIDQLVQSLQSGVVKYGAAFLSQKRHEDVNKLLSSSFVFCACLGVVACVAILAARAFSSDLPSGMDPALVIMAVLALLVVPVTPYLGIIRSTQRFYINAIADTCARYLALGLIILWFSIGKPTVMALVAIMAITLLLARWIQIPFAYRFVPSLKNRVNQFNIGILKTIAAFGGAVVIISLCLAVNNMGLRWIMGAVVSTAFVAKMVIIIMPAMLLSQIIRAATATIMPAASAYHAVGKKDLLNELLMRGMRYTFILLFVALITASLLMREALDLWVGPDYRFLAPYALAVFAGYAFVMFASVSHNILKGMGKIIVVMLSYLAGFVILPVGITLGLLSASQNPYMALVTGLVVGYLVTGSVQIGCCAKVLDTNVWTLLFHVGVQPLGIALPISAIAVAATYLPGFDGFVQRVCIAVLGVLVFLGGYYALIATPAERRQVKEIFIWARRRLLPARGPFV